MLKKIKFSKKFFIISLASILAVGAFLPVAVTTIISKQNNFNNNDFKFKFDDRVFNNKNELFNYAKQIVRNEKFDIKNNEKWSIDFNNQTLFFSNINELFSFLESKIITHTANTSLDIDLGIDGSINYQDLKYLNLDQNNLERVEIYRGKDNSYFLSENEAKDTYLQIHDTYFFDNIFFRTKEELKAYLDLNYEKINDSKSKNIVIKSPTGEMSLPLNLQKLKDKDEKELDKLVSFVNLYAKEYLQVKFNLNDKEQFKYFSEEEVKNNFSEILTYFDDPSFININSNKGKPNFLVDLHKDDEFDLFGPYYTEASASLMNITNPDAWQRVEGDSWNFNDNQKVSMLLSSFMDCILYEDDDFPYPIGLDEIKNETKSYFDYLKDKYPYVYDKVINLYQTMKNGKRYSPFYKLPILYIKTIEELIFLSADQNIIEITRAYYKKVAQCFDDRLYALIPKEFLKPNVEDSKYKMLSFVDLFNIDNKTFDLNTDIESFVDVIILQYSNFVNLLEFLPAVIFFSLYLPNVYDYNESLVKFINKNFQFKDNLKDSYKLVWNILNTSDKDTFIDLVSKTYLNNTNKDIDDKVLEILLCNFVLKKDVFIKNVIFNIEKDLNAFAEGNKVFFDSDSFFSGMPMNTIKSFLNLYKYNGNKIDFSVFAILKIIFLSKYYDYLYYISFQFAAFKYDDVKTIKKYYNDSLKFFNNKNTQTIIKNISTIFGSNFMANITSTENINLIDWENYGIFLDVSSKLNDLYSLLGGIADVTKKLEKFTRFFKAVPYLNVVFFVIDAVVPRISKFSYYFECEGSKYIWNGGSELKFFFGLITVNQRDITSMKINEPIQVTQQHLNNAYYYNGKEYFDFNTLKRDQLLDILNGRFKYNDSIKTVYSFDKIGNEFIQSSNKVFNEIGTLDFKDDDLIDKVYKRVINLDKEIVIDNVYTYGNGFTFDENISKIRNIEELVKNIKPTKVAMKPILNDKNMPISNDSNLDDGSVPNYVLPGKSWTSSGGFSYNSIDNYIIIDQNIENGQLYDINSQLKESFYNEFDVPSKTILEVDLYSKNNFSSYSNNINSYYVYGVELDNGYKKFFKDKSVALKWYLVNSNFKVYGSVEKLDYYYYANNVFDNIDSYLDWVLKNSEVIYE